MKALGRNVAQRRFELRMSQADLAKASGVSQQSIAAIEGGQIARPRMLPEIAAALGVSTDYLLGTPVLLPTAASTATAPFAIPDIAFGALPQDVPVYGVVQGGDGDGEFFFNGQTIDHVRRPPGIANARDVFAMYVIGSSMWPRFDEGMPVYVSGARPPAIGDDVVVELHPESEGSPQPGFIKRLVRRSPSKIILEQFNPAMEIEIETAKVKRILRVVPWVELLGI